ncbi:MAG: DUF3422 domain-containing protein [Hyphomicrobiales bacterium]|nr:DUF3422 domain-containing protein [Hyphomicrobiales bacterium]
MHDHSERISLANEFHARPFAYLQAPEQASYFAMLLGGTCVDRLSNSRRRIRPNIDSRPCPRPSTGGTTHSAPARN